MKTNPPPSLAPDLCLPLHGASRLIARAWQPLLEPLGLTYAQYLVLRVLWESSPRLAREIAARARLEMDVLTPLLATLAEKGLLARSRHGPDETAESVALTPTGQRLQAYCASIAPGVLARAGYPAAQAAQLDKLLRALMEGLERLPD